jgi:hypothetical protein
MARSRYPLVSIPDALFFAAVFFFTRFWINPSYLYAYPGFFRNITVETYAPWFISFAPQYPGRLTDVIVSAAAPLLSNAWAGSAIIALLVSALCRLLGRILSELGLVGLTELKFVPGLLAVCVLCCGRNPFPGGVALVLGLLAALLHTVFARRLPRLRLGLYLALAAAVYIAAIEAYLTFVIVCAIFELSPRKNLLGAFAALAVGACVPPALSLTVFPLFPVAESYIRTFPGRSAGPFRDGILSLAFLIAPLSAIFIAAVFGAVFRLPVFAGQKKSRRLSALRSPTVRRAAIGISVAFFGAVLFWACGDSMAKTRSTVRLSRALVSENWDRLIAVAKKTPVTRVTPYQVNAIDLALYHRGRLLEDLFRFPQNQNTLLVFPFTRSTNPTDRFYDMVWGAQTWYDLGVINVAEHCALEALTVCYHPEGLRLLSRIYLVKNMPQAARTCLAALAKDGGYRAWAAATLDSLSSNPAFSFPETPFVKSVSMKSRFILTGIPPFDTLLRENPYNRMALEYQVAWNLIRRNIDSLQRYVPAFRNLGYQKIPLLMEEALLLSGAYDEQREISGYSPSPEAAASFSRYYSILFTRHNGDAREAFKELADSCGYSYFFYYSFGFSRANLSKEPRP